MRLPKLRWLAALLFLGVLIAGCSTDHSMDAADMNGDSNSSEEVQTSSNMADIAFAQMMIPHHEQAVVMSDYALANTDNPQILALAQEIIEAQGPEIDQMTAILDRFNMDMGGHGGHTMAGMLTDEELEELQTAQGPEFDQLFLVGMIAHHEGAIDMAEDALASGADPEVRELAQAIVAGQEAEIEYMQELLNN